MSYSGTPEEVRRKRLAYKYAHIEKIREQDRAIQKKRWALKTKEEKQAVAEKKKQWVANNREHHRQYSREYYAKNIKGTTKNRPKNPKKRPWKPTERTKSTARYYAQKHMARIVKRALEKRHSDPIARHTHNLKNHRRKARDLGAKGHYTAEQFLARVQFFEWKCRYCQCSLTLYTLTVDHQIPLSRGGSNWPSNLVPSCKSCNSRKHNKTPKEFISSPIAKSGPRHL